MPTNVKTGKQPLLNTGVNNLSRREAVEEIARFVAAGEKAYVVPINVDVVMKLEKDAYLRQIAREADLVLVDGKPLVWIAKLHGKPVKEKVSGSDLTVDLCALAAEKGYSIYFIGGKDGVAEEAKRRLERQFPGIRVVGACSPPLGFEKDPAALARIREDISALRPDLVFACLGCPKQEKWIYENYRDIDAGVFVCAGATVDFLAGNVRRAPKWMSEHGLEWFFRFLMEPKRLFKRYFVDDMQILGLVWKYRPGRK